MGPISLLLFYLTFRAGPLARRRFGSLLVSAGDLKALFPLRSVPQLPPHSKALSLENIYFTWPAYFPFLDTIKTSFG